MIPHPDDVRAESMWAWLRAKWEGLREYRLFIRWVLSLIIVACVVAFVVDRYTIERRHDGYADSSEYGSGGDTGSGSDAYAGTDLDFSGCNVAAIELHGCIATYDSTGDSVFGSEDACSPIVESDTVVSILESAAASDDVKGILLDIDSPGGEPQAAYEIAAALKASGKPSVAWIRGYGDSAAYWIASAANTIVASPVSDVGSIGITQSYTDDAKKNEADGVTYNELSTGKYKNTGSTDKSLTEDERAYLEEGLQQFLDVFVSAVATNRHLSEAAVRSLADGRSWAGADAKGKGLVDVLGTKPEALGELQKKIGEEPVLCWPQYGSQ